LQQCEISKIFLGRHPRPCFKGRKKGAEGRLGEESEKLRKGIQEKKGRGRRMRIAHPLISA